MLSELSIPVVLAPTTSSNRESDDGSQMSMAMNNLKILASKNVNLTSPPISERKSSGNMGPKLSLATVCHSLRRSTAFRGLVNKRMSNECYLPITWLLVKQICVSSVMASFKDTYGQDLILSSRLNNCVVIHSVNNLMVAYNLRGRKKMKIPMSCNLRHANSRQRRLRGSD